MGHGQIPPIILKTLKFYGGVFPAGGVLPQPTLSSLSRNWVCGASLSHLRFLSARILTDVAISTTLVPSTSCPPK